MKRVHCGFFCLLLSVQLIGQSAFELSLDRSDHTYEVGVFASLRIQSFESGFASFRIRHANDLFPIESDDFFLQVFEDRQILFSLPYAGSILIEVEMNGERQTLGAVFSPFEIPALATAPDDFDKFWGEQRVLLRSVPMDTQIDFQSRSDRSTTYKISLALPDARRANGYLVVPTNPSDEYNAVVMYKSPEEALETRIAEVANVILLAIDRTTDEPDPDNNISIADKNTLKYDILAGLRAIDYLQSRTDFGGHLTVTGKQQSGALANMVAGLEDEVEVLISDQSTHAQHQGSRFGRASGFPSYLEATRKTFPGDQERYERTAEAVNYYDLIHFSTRFQGIAMQTVQYTDTLAPAETVLASFNQLTDKRILQHQLYDDPNNNDWTLAQIQRFLPNPFSENGKAIGHYIDIMAERQISVGEELVLNGVALFNTATLQQHVQWSVVNENELVVFSDKNNLTTTVTFEQPGTYALQLLVEDRRELTTDGVYYTLIDQVQIEVVESRFEINCPEDISVIASGELARVFWDLPTLANTSCNRRDISIVQMAGPRLGSEVAVGIYDISYRVNDECGQELTCAFQVEVLPDTTSFFNIDCPEDISVVASGEKARVSWALPQLDSTSCASQNLTIVQTQGQMSGSEVAVGIYDISYRVSDECGQELTCAFQVEVLPDTTTVFGITCPDDIYRTVSKLGETIVIEWDEPIISVPCEAGYTLRRTTGVPSGSRFTIGYADIVYQLKDNCGNEATCSFKIFVDQAPIGNRVLPFPNPVQKVVHFPIVDQWSVTQLTITDAFGRVVVQQTVSSNETLSVNSQQWQQGTYFWQLRDRVGVVTQFGRLVKIE